MRAASVSGPTPIPADVERRILHLPDAGVDIAIQDWGGDGPLVLLHHANGFCAGMWGEVALALRERAHLVAMDARGHGDSSLPAAGVNAATYSWPLLAGDLVAVADDVLARTGAPRFALGVGHSFGGTLTFAAAAGRPDLFERILLLDPVILPPMDEAAAQRHAAESDLARRARRRRADWPDRASARAYCLEKSLFEHWTETALDLYLQEGLRERADGGVELKCSGLVESQVFAGGASLNPYELAERLQVPTRILWAAQGNFDRSRYEALVAPVPDARVETIEAGHLIPMERPDLVIRAIEASLPA